GAPPPGGGGPAGSASWPLPGRGWRRRDEHRSRRRRKSADQCQAPTPRNAALLCRSAGTPGAHGAPWGCRPVQRPRRSTRRPASGAMRDTASRRRTPGRRRADRSAACAARSHAWVTRAEDPALRAPASNHLLCLPLGRLNTSQKCIGPIYTALHRYDKLMIARLAGLADLLDRAVGRQIDEAATELAADV